MDEGSKTLCFKCVAYKDEKHKQVNRYISYW